jgi:hypothetical protein
MEFPLLIALFPIVFMIHDFEEIIMMKSWIDKNKDFLLLKFPIIGKRMVKNFEDQSTASFALSVAEEFVIISIAVFLALQYKWYWLWIALFMAFFIHLFIHIVQWIVVRRYIPAIITSFLALFYCGYEFRQFLMEYPLSIIELICLGLIGIVLMMVNLYIIHKLSAKFEKWLRKYSIN